MEQVWQSNRSSRVEAHTWQLGVATVFWRARTNRFEISCPALRIPSMSTDP